MSGGKKKNVFISHHHKDDAQVDKLAKLLSKNGLDIRNSSIRAKPANQSRLEKGMIKDSTIKRLLKMKMSWAGSVIVIIGKETHSREWVNWEIETASRLGKNIIGVYENGLKDKVDLPPALEKLGTSLIGWDSGAIMSAIEGKPDFKNPDGTPRARKDGTHETC